MHPYISFYLQTQFSRVRHLVERHLTSRSDVRAGSGVPAMATAVPNGESLINTHHKPQKQVRLIITPLDYVKPFIEQIPETPTCITSPSTTSNFSLLLDLPIEIQIEIVEFLQADWQATIAYQRQTHPLKSLRLTCKQLEALCNPVFAQCILINPRDRPAGLEIRKELAPKFAKYLKVMEISLLKHQKEDNSLLESVCTTILEHAVHLRRLALCHFSTYTMAHDQLLSAISKLNALEDVIIWEFDFASHLQSYRTVQTTFHHRLLNQILDYHSQRLRVLVVCGRTPMHESTFLKLRDTASQLRHLELSRCLTTETRDVFTHPQRWACAGHLQYLYIWRCAIQSATITRHIGAGVFGPLRTFHMVGCGDVSDDPLELAATTWTIPPLSKVQVEHFNDREMDSLSCIRAKKVCIKRVWSGRRPCIEAFRKSTTFPEAVELHVEKEWDDKGLEELRRTCAMRGLMKVKRDLPPPVP